MRMWPCSVVQQIAPIPPNLELKATQTMQGTFKGSNCISIFLLWPYYAHFICFYLGGIWRSFQLKRFTKALANLRW